MQFFSPEQTDELCKRSCAFALYALPGRDVEFCMQEDGGTTDADAEGFMIAPYCGKRLLIRKELSTPPDAECFPLSDSCTPHTNATTREQYHHLFSQYTAELKQDRLQKVVLARTQDFPAPNFSPSAAFLKACQNSPHAFNALFHTPEYGTWICSTPELLLSREGDTWQTMALAGSRTEPQTQWDAKNLQEHALVVDHILSCLNATASSITTDGPHTLAAGNTLEHLCTRIRFTMRPAALPELLSTLPPTPAVSGYPTAAARAFIQEHADIERSCYAGYLGPISKNHTHLFVTLRCMQIFPNICRLYAGGGLMPDSEEESEWAETTAKMQSMLQLIQ
jgi:isochorismate synthase